MESLNASDLSNLTGLPVADIAKLAHEGIIEPQIHRSKGSGDHSIYGEKNLAELTLISRLQSLGLKREMIRQILVTINKSRVNWWKSGGWLVGESGPQWKWTVTDNLRFHWKAFNDQPMCFIVKIEPLKT